MAERALVIPGRFSFAHVWEPWAGEDGGTPKFQVSFLVPKSDKKTIEQIEAAIEAAKKYGASKLTKWNGKVPGKLGISFKDGDVEKPDDPVYKGMMYISAKNTDQPFVVDKNRKPILDKSEFYSGCYGYAAIEFYPFEKPSNGVAASLSGVMKTKDGEALGAKRITADEAFADVDLSDIEVDDDL